VEVVVPDLGDFADVEVIEVLVKLGEDVVAEQGLVTLETEKATMDIPAPAAGRVGELKVKVGDRVSKGSVILLLEASATETAAAEDTRPEEDRTVLQPRVVPDDAGSAASSMPIAEPRTVVVPDLGDFAEVEIIEILVKPGDHVTAEQGVVTLETEKASMDVPAPESGEILAINVAVGGKVSAGDALLVLRPAAVSPKVASAPVKAQSAPQSQSQPQPAAKAATPARRSEPTRSAVAATATTFGEAHASPSVRKLARELGVDLGRVRGSGSKGRVTVDDVKAFVKEVVLGGGQGPAALPAVPTVDFAKYGQVETQPLTRIQRIAGPRLHASWVNIPHVTQHDCQTITCPVLITCNLTTATAASVLTGANT
jgi:pyruvate dehydrogenase E2 component (dihydrolipoamide acetyltransferase)